MDRREIIKYFEEKRVITRGKFVGKSGTEYSIETDLRNALLSYDSAQRTAQMLVSYIYDYIDDAAFIGVPETGSLLAFYLNEAKHRRSGNDYMPNMLRSIPKEYQLSTNSVFTVLPVDVRQRYVLVEDDVVTGSTLCKYLRIAKEAGVNIVGVVTVFGRDSAITVKKLCEEYGIPYLEVINVKNIPGDV